jgi:glycerol-3-phosphate dehydrogenase (NAD(P)+)
VTGPARVTVAGAGSWGTALAMLLAANGHRVTLWCREPEVAEGIARKHHNPLYLPDVDLPESLAATGDLAEAMGAARDLLVWVVPSQFTRAVLEQARPHLGPEVPVVSASKGIEVSTLKLLSEVFAELLGEGTAERFAVLSGPSFAKEVARGMPTAVAAGGTNPEVGRTAQRLFGCDRFRVYTNHDPVGTQVGGALKNVVAIAAGAVEGLGLGHNTQAVLVTRGLAEMTRLGVALGADPRTFAGLAGLGDLVLTCTGDLSRNRGVGVALGQGRTLEDFLGTTGQVAEGVKTTAAAHELAARLGVEMPIVAQVYRVLFEGASPKDALSHLMARPQKAEEDVT